MGTIKDYSQFTKDWTNEEVIKYIDSLIAYTNSEENKRFEINFIRGILAYLLHKKFGDGNLYVTAINEIYPNEYPFNIEVSAKGFEQFEIVLDKSQRKFEIGIVLDVFNDVIVGSDCGLTSELRLDTNGVVYDNKIAKMNLSEFWKRLNLKNYYHGRILKGLLVESEKYVAVAINKDYLVQVSKPTSYNKAREMNSVTGSPIVLPNEKFRVISETNFNSYNKKIK